MSRRPNSGAGYVRDGELDSFLRSINLCFDADYPDRIAHFRPTAKCIRLLTALAGQERERAYFIVAPYGSGKSIAASYLLQLVENRPSAIDLLRTVEQRLAGVSESFAEFARARRRKGSQGLVVALQGYCPSFPEALKSSILQAMDRQRLGREARTIRRMPAKTTEDAVAILKTLMVKAEESGRDRVALVWDEFGRHVESLVAEGRTSQLNDIQLLAEFAARCKPLPLTIGLILHQDLFNYASSLPQTVRTEWKKVEGRFQVLQYVDLSRETYRLIAGLVAARSGESHSPSTTYRQMAKRCLALHLFSDFSVTELADLLMRAYPMDPAALWVLPRISARVAQNERTLFSFLSTADYCQPISPAMVFDYFSSLMQSDIGFGGTYKKWVETQTAIEKVTDLKGAAEALKCVALLGFGINGQRGTVPSDLAEFAIAGYKPISEASALCKQLLARKVLLHRKHNDEITIWHGSDTDLRGHLENEKSRQRPTFDLFAFLHKEAPPNVWRPTRYNDDYMMHRYFRSTYVSLDGLRSYLGTSLSAKVMPDSRDGMILHVVPESVEQLQTAEQMLTQDLVHERVLVALPRSVPALKEACLEVWSLATLQTNQDLVGSDPLILPELRQMTDDARAHLDRTVQSLVSPHPNGPRWFHQRKEVRVLSNTDLRAYLSSIMEHVYPSTPRFNNESVVRNHPTATIVNSRKKLIIGILERSGTKDLGIQGEFPDSSMFRTILQESGLYYQRRSGAWEYAAPQKLRDPGLVQIWLLLEDFFTRPNAAGKSFAALLDDLRRPPFGIRNGVLPILIAAAFRAFPGAFALNHVSRGYIEDLRPSDIEELCAQPGAYRLIVYKIDQETAKLLGSIRDLFASARDQYKESDLLRASWDSIQEWYSRLPAASRASSLIGADAHRLRELLESVHSPPEFFFRSLPDLVAGAKNRTRSLLAMLKIAKEELEMVSQVYHARARSITIQAFAFDSTDTAHAQRVAQEWARCFPVSFVEALSNHRDRGLFKRIRVPYTSDERFIDAIAVLLDCGPVDTWTDSTVNDYQRALSELVTSLEDRAVSSSALLFPQLEAREQLAELFVDRIRCLSVKLTNVVGQEGAYVHLSRLMAKLQEEMSCGLHK